MSDSDKETQNTQHAFLVAWGWFAQEIGLIERFQALKLQQKHYHHAPQTKVLEFLVSILGGLEHLQDISLSAHPLDKDQAVAEAWGQPQWANYSGVSRTLSSLTWEEVHQIVQILDEMSQRYIDSEIQLIRSQGQRVQHDGDLTGIPVSNTSRSYQNAAFGHMDDEIRLGYQAAVNSMESPTYGRLWLSGAHHPGDTVSCTQAEALLLAAEARTGLRPMRRTDLLRKRIEACEQQMTETKKQQETQEQALQKAKARLAEAEKLEQERQTELANQEKSYQEKQRKERPTSRLAQARERAQASVKRLHSRQTAWKEAQKQLDRATAHWKQEMDTLTVLYQRLKLFEQENASNANPIEASYRLDAGFGAYENIAFFIEMGYQVDTKAYGNQAVPYLKELVNDQTNWTHVGANAEMVAWSDFEFKKCPYRLDVALERFHTGKTLKHSALLHFGSDPRTTDLTGWFKKYNSRQTIEAGIKESKQVFYLHHIKVRSEPAIYLQERFVLFAANFIRWASHWLIEQAQPAENALEVGKLGVKRQVQVVAHMSAQVIQNSEGKMLKFSDQSAFAGKILKMAPVSRPDLRKDKF